MGPILTVSRRQPQALAQGIETASLCRIVVIKTKLRELLQPAVCHQRNDQLHGCESMVEHLEFATIVLFAPSWRVACLEVEEAKFFTITE